MRFRDALTLHTSPLLLRLVLAVIFMWASIPKFETITFEGDAAATLVELGIGQKTVVAGQAPQAPQEEESTPAEPEPAPSEAEDDTPPPSPAGEEGAESDQPQGDTPSGETEQEGGGAGDAAGESAAVSGQEPEPHESGQANSAEGAQVQYTVRAKMVEYLTIMLHHSGHPYPRIFAWVAMGTEIIGGALLLVGLFSRVWGLGLAIAMVYAFVLASLPAIQAKVDPAATNSILAFVEAFRATEQHVQSGAMLQITLFVASWCIFIGGPGGLSLDRLIFRRRADA